MKSAVKPSIAGAPSVVIETSFLIGMFFSLRYLLNSLQASLPLVPLSDWQKGEKVLLCCPVFECHANENNQLGRIRHVYSFIRLEGETFTVWEVLVYLLTNLLGQRFHPSVCSWSSKRHVLDGCRYPMFVFKVWTRCQQQQPSLPPWWLRLR